jgi:hypothetical protein
VRIAVPAGERPQLALTRADGSPARLLSLALPAPSSGERYIPFGDEMVLTGSSAT